MSKHKKKKLNQAAENAVDENTEATKADSGTKASEGTEPEDGSIGTKDQETEAAKEPETDGDASEKPAEESASEDEDAKKEEENIFSKKKGLRRKDDKKSSKANQEDGSSETSEEGFVERKITESERSKLHERFKFDWELEENIIEALDESADELEELDEEEEEAEPEPMQFKSITFAQAAQALFGLFLIIFSVIGVIATGFKIAEVAEQKKDNSEQLAYFEDFLMPLVACDSPTFDSASSLNEDVIITAACWDIILNPSSFYELSSGTYSVSYLDIDRRITKLFGPGLSYTHKTVGDTELTFEYNEETGMYEIPAFPRAPAYYPEVTQITETPNGTELTVQYRLPITNWIESADTVEKTMIYTVVPSETDYNITAIRIGEIAGEAAN